METLYGGKRLDRIMPLPEKPMKKKCNSSEMGSVIGIMVAFDSASTVRGVAVSCSRDGSILGRLL